MMSSQHNMETLLHSMQVEGEGTDGEEITLALPTNGEAQRLVAEAVKAERQLIGKHIRVEPEGPPVVNHYSMSEWMHQEQSALNKAVGCHAFGVYGSLVRPRKRRDSR